MLADRSMHHIYPRKKAQGRVSTGIPSGSERCLERHRNPEKIEYPTGMVCDVHTPALTQLFGSVSIVVLIVSFQTAFGIILQKEVVYVCD